jgi:hypothetical protein
MREFYEEMSEELGGDPTVDEDEDEGIGFRSLKRFRGR